MYVGGRESYIPKITFSSNNFKIMNLPGRWKGEKIKNNKIFISRKSIIIHMVGKVGSRLGKCVEQVICTPQSRPLMASMLCGNHICGV